MGKRRKQQTDTLPMGDAIELYVQTLHRKRKPLKVEEALGVMGRAEQVENILCKLGLNLNDTNI